MRRNDAAARGHAFGDRQPGVPPLRIPGSDIDDKETERDQQTAVILIKQIGDGRAMSQSDFEKVVLKFTHNHEFEIEVHKRVLDMVEKRLNDLRKHYLSSIFQCESPIEQILGVALEIELERNKLIWNWWKLNPVIVPQAEIKNYRADFLIDVVDTSLQTIVAAVVECDGHDNHERTKEQAKRDKSRDRFMQSLGYMVFRFTGSEIWEDPYKCAKEVFSVLEDKARKYMSDK